MTAYVRLELETAGVSIDEAGAQMVAVAKALRTPTMASFNGVWLRADPSMVECDVVEQYRADLKFRIDAERIFDIVSG